MAAASATAKPALKIADAAKKKSLEQPKVAIKKPRSLKAQIIEFISEFLKYVAPLLIGKVANCHLRKYLAPLSEFPMYEVYYYNKSKIESVCIIKNNNKI